MKDSIVNPKVGDYELLAEPLKVEVKSRFESYLNNNKNEQLQLKNSYRLSAEKYKKYLYLFGRLNESIVSKKNYKISYKPNPDNSGVPVTVADVHDLHSLAINIKKLREEMKSCKDKYLILLKNEHRFIEDSWFLAIENAKKHLEMQAEVEQFMAKWNPKINTDKVLCDKNENNRQVVVEHRNKLAYRSRFVRDNEVSPSKISASRQTISESFSSLAENSSTKGCVSAEIYENGKEREKVTESENDLTLYAAGVANKANRSQMFLGDSDAGQKGLSSNKNKSELSPIGEKEFFSFFSESNVDFESQDDISVPESKTDYGEFDKFFDLRASTVGKSPQAKELIFSEREEAIKKIVAERKIPHLVHFTDIRNLPDILSNGLLARDKLDSNRAFFSDSKRLDGYLNRISLSITIPNSRMLYKKRKAGVDDGFAILVLKKEILWELDCLFFSSNAAIGEFRTVSKDILSSPDALLSMFDSSNSTKNPCLTKDQQAEVMVKDFIPATYIKSIHFLNNSAKNKAEELVGYSVFNGVKLEVNSLFFGKFID